MFAATPSFGTFRAGTANGIATAQTQSTARISFATSVANTPSFSAVRRRGRTERVARESQPVDTEAEERIHRQLLWLNEKASTINKLYDAVEGNSRT
jgi:hypothetical protein